MKTNAGSVDISTATLESCSEFRRICSRAAFSGSSGVAGGWPSTVAVAAIHAVVIGFALWVLGVPLLVPLVILVFLAAFIPLVGILVAGTIAVAVTLGTRGWVPGFGPVTGCAAEGRRTERARGPDGKGRGGRAT